MCVVHTSKMTDFSMNDILRSFRKMRMNKGSAQGGHYPCRSHQQQPPQNIQVYQHTSPVQHSKDLKKIIKIIKKNLIKEKITHSATTNMVYYSANQLLIKTEQTSQAQFCLQVPPPLTATTASVALSLGVPPSGGQQEQFELLQTPQQRQLQLQLQDQHHQHHQEQQQFVSYQLAIQQHQKQKQHESITTTTPTTPTTGAAPAAQRIKTEPSGLFPAAAAVASQVQVRKPSANKPQFKCDQCGMTFGSKSAHTSHTKSHAKNADPSLSAGVEAGAAGAAGTASSTAIELNDEGLPVGIPKSPTIKPLANVAAGADPYQCNVCQKTFAVPARLIRHYRTHTGERPFECEFCHKLFSVKENLQVHRRIHTKERPYKCDVCGRAFEHSGKLHRHMRIHTGERPHKCSVCEKTFIQSGQLVIHMRTHTGEKPYKCPEPGCGKGFTCSKQLKVHSRTHTGEKPYHCDICFRDFGYNHVLKLHRVQHYGSKCYKCTICDETFKNKKEMEAHIKGHANELPDDEAEAEAEAAAALASAGSSAGSPSMQGVGSTSESSNHSPPSSPPVTKKPRQARPPRGPKAGPAALSLASSSSSPLSPSSLSSTYSPSATSLASPPPTSAHYLPAQMETDALSRDSGVSSAQAAHSFADEELPTDLSMQQGQGQGTASGQTAGYYQAPPSLLELQPQAPGTSINPALLEAANMARRHHDNDDQVQDEDVHAAAWQMMQLRRGHGSLPPTEPQTQMQTQSQTHQQQVPTLHVSDLAANYDDTHEATVLIEHFKRGDLARHGLHKGYAPVPKYESALPNPDIVRRVEAAIGLRSSTESPERSSSPESDSLMMADRNVMTLPLRKRKHYMNKGEDGESEKGVGAGGDGPASGSGSASASVGAGEGAGSKVMRMSSVIQFAKAS
ncbi:Krueppel homolog 1-like isoform X3 [Drosophila elegans]|uniref:Krueppel homolog 1-like isoform X3 n=2 Tax=Drosophila elegans TaxID=30023 RepID=UPI0007E5DB2D|nr:Krueppel homolog 1-like isoform X3 [Drosophila elegans]